MPATGLKADQQAAVSCSDGTTQYVFRTPSTNPFGSLDMSGSLQNGSSDSGSLGTLTVNGSLGTITTTGSGDTTVNTGAGSLGS